MSDAAAPTVIDLFCGCGGLTRGFTDAGFNVVGAIDNDRAAAATFAANFGPESVIWGPIEEFLDVPAADVIVGGPPCQGFSGLGKKDPLDVRNSLWRDYARVVRASGCSVFVLENVGRFTNSKEMTALRRSFAEGELFEGFTLEPYLLNAADYGTPQKRSRTILIGTSIGTIGQPPATHDKDSAKATPWRTVEDAIDHFDVAPPLGWPETHSEFGGAPITGPLKLDEIHVGRTYQDRSIQRFKWIKKGGNRFDLPDDLKAECWKKHTTGSGDVMGRLWWDKPSVTIRTEFFKPEKGRYLHPDAHRALTHAEAAVLQGFDERHEWCGNRSQVARQIGNAVPPPLAQAIAQQVHAAIVKHRANGEPAS